jgi:hypothetical protein
MKPRSAVPMLLRWPVMFWRYRRSGFSVRESICMAVRKRSTLPLPAPSSGANER